MHDRLGVEVLQIRIGLSSADEHDGLTSCVGHRDGGADLVVDRVELGQDDAVYGAHVLLATGTTTSATNDAARRAMVDQRLVELLHLVDGLVAHERLAHEQHQVRIVHIDQLELYTSKTLVSIPTSYSQQEQEQK